MDDIKIIVGKRIQERRTELRMTQEEFAKKVGYKSRSAIAKIETGNSDLPQTKVYVGFLDNKNEATPSIWSSLLI